MNKHYRFGASHITLNPCIMKSNYGLDVLFKLTSLGPYANYINVSIFTVTFGLHHAVLLYQPQPCSEANWDDKMAIVVRPNITEVPMPS
jgi:hypothetical protein